jgi:PAS domain S-box-containing protein
MAAPYEFSLEHWPAVALALVPAILNLGLFAYVLVFGKRNTLTYTFAAFVGTLMVWQFSDAMIRLSADQASAQFWGAVLGLGALMIAPTGMEFTLQFIGRGDLVRRPLVLVLLWGPAVLIETATRAGLGRSQLAPNEPWAWAAVGPAPVLTLLYGVWIASLSLAMLFLLVRFSLRTPRPDPRRGQAMLVAIGFAIPTIQGTVTEVIFPNFLGLPNLPIASTMMTTFTIAAVIALRDYKFLRTHTVEEQLLEATQTLREERKALEQAEQIAHLGSWDWDMGAKKVTWSPEMYRIYGVERAEFTPNAEAITAHHPPEDREPFAATIRDAIAKNTPFEFEHRILRGDGETRWVVAHGQVRLDADGRPRLSGTTQDITERRKAERERQELERLRAVDEYKTQFLSMAAHELNTPLTPLKAQLYLLQTDPDEMSKQDRARSLEILGRNLDRLGRLVGDLLEAARVQSGRLRVDVAPLQVAPLIEEVVHAFAKPAQDAGVSLDAGMQGDPIAMADSTRVSQVLYNLVSNAIKFTPRGGRVHIRCKAVGPNLEFRVEDSGIGLEREQVDRLFQPFSRVHELQGTHIRGTGLGLFISRSIIELHGGHLLVESPGRNRGSTFIVTMPLAPPGAEPAAVLPIVRAR